MTVRGVGEGSPWGLVSDLLGKRPVLIAAGKSTFVATPSKPVAAKATGKGADPRGWRFPDDVEKSFAACFRTKKEPAEQVRDAAKVLARARLEQITDSDAKRDALRGIDRAFPKRQLLWGKEVTCSADIRRVVADTLLRGAKGPLPTLHDFALEYVVEVDTVDVADIPGKVVANHKATMQYRFIRLWIKRWPIFTDFPEPTIHPDLTPAITGDIARAALCLHSVELHYRDQQGWSLIPQRTLANPANRVGTGVVDLATKLFVPGIKLYAYAKQWWAYRRGLGAEWELLHRLPDSVRGQALAELSGRWTGRGLDPALLTNPRSPQVVRATLLRDREALVDLSLRLRDLFGPSGSTAPASEFHNEEFAAGAWGIYRLYRAVSAASLAKRAFVATMGRTTGSYFLGESVIKDSYRYHQSEGATTKMQFWGAVVWESFKAAGMLALLS